MCARYSPRSRSAGRLAPRLTRRATLASGLAALLWRRRSRAAGANDPGLEPFAYLATCDGRVGRVQAASGETTGSWSLVELGWAAAVQDGCVLDGLTFRPPDSLLAIIPRDPTVDEDGTRHFRVLEWDLKDWKLKRSLDLANPLASPPSLLAPRQGAPELLLAYQKAEGAAMTQLDPSKIGDAAARLSNEGDGPWFSRNAVWGSGEIVDRTQVLVVKEGRWQAVELSPPTFEQMPWSWVGPKLSGPPAGKLEGVFYSTARDGRTTLLLWAGKPVAITHIEGMFGAKQLAPTVHGSRLVSAGPKEPAQLWELPSGKLLARAPEDWQRPQRVVCLREDGTCILQGGGRIFLFGPERSREVFFDGPADSFLHGVFAS